MMLTTLFVILQKFKIFEFFRLSLVRGKFREIDNLYDKLKMMRIRALRNIRFENCNKNRLKSIQYHTYEVITYNVLYI